MTPFRQFWVGETVSSFGSYVTLLALQTLVVLTLGGTAQDVGLLSSARWLPYLVLGLVLGALVDRRRRRPVMVGTDLARAALLLVLPVSWLAGVLSMPLLLVVVLGFGTASLLNDAASQSFVPRLVPRAELQRAHARLDGADAVAQTCGPALAGLLVRLVGAPFAVLVNAATFVFSAVTVWRLRVVEPVPVPAPLPNLRREIGEGLRWVYGRSGLAVLAVATHVWFAGNAVLGAVLASYALVTIGLTAFQFGLVTACAGLGALLGAAGSGFGGRRLGAGGAVITAHLACGVGAGVAVAAGLGAAGAGAADGWTAVAVLALAQALHGFGLAFGNSHEMSYRQALTPDALQARTNTTMRSFNRAVVVVVAPLGGLLAVQLGERVALLAAAAAFLLAALVLALSPFRRVRRVDDGPVADSP